MALPDIGEMNKVLKFELMDKDSDQTGGQNEHGKDWFTCRGAYREVNGYRKLESGYDETVTVADLFIWWRQAIENDLSKDTQVIYDNRFYSVETFKKVGEKRKMLQITVKTAR